MLASQIVAFYYQLGVLLRAQKQNLASIVLSHVMTVSTLEQFLFCWVQKNEVILGWLVPKVMKFPYILPSIDIILPFLWRIFVTPQLQCDLKIIGSQIVEVLHTTSYWIPSQAHCSTARITGDTHQAAPLVIPPCWANSETGESQPGVEGLDILEILNLG